MYAIFILLWTCYALAHSITVEDCPEGVERDKYLKVYGDQCYHFEVNEERDFVDARAYCKQHGGDLVLVKSKQVNDFLQNQLVNTYGYKYTYFWIGLQYYSEYAGHYWVNGDFAFYNNFQDMTSYGLSTCAVMVPDTGKWKHLSCKSSFFANNEHPFICEYSTVPRTTSSVLPSTQPLPSVTTDNCPPGVQRDQYLQVYRETCYAFLIKQYKGFEEAQNYCQQDGGNLAIVESRDINSFLQKELTETYRLYNTQLWIGLRYEIDYDQFYWVDGTLMKYKNFQNNNFYTSNECVAMVTSSGKWYNYRCRNSNFLKENEFHFICQYPVTYTTRAPTNAPATPKAATTLATTTVDGCPSTIKHPKVYKDMCYQIKVDQLKDFQDAQKYCQEFGGNLATVKSEAINNFLFNQLIQAYDYYDYPVWIGLRYNPDKQRHLWVDGTQLDYKRFTKNYFLGPHYCIAINALTGKWDNLRCQQRDNSEDEMNPFICEYPRIVSASPSPSQKTSVSLHECPDGLARDEFLTVFGGKCYRFFLQTRESFDQSQKTCQQEGGNLALVKSKDIDQFVRAQLTTVYGDREPVWIGLRYHNAIDKFLWLDGTDVDFDKPLGNTESDHLTECVVLNPSDGTWKVLECENPLSDSKDTVHYFVCEYDGRTAATKTTTSIQTTSTTTTSTLNTTTKRSTMTTTVPTTTIPATTAPTTTTTTTAPTTTTPTTTIPTTTTTAATTTTPTTTTTTPTTTTSTTTTPTTTTTTPTTTAATTTTPTTTTTTPTTTTSTTTTPTTTTTTPTTTYIPFVTTACPSLVCDLDCGLDGFKVNTESGCVMCECDS